MMVEPKSRILVTGASGLVGSALVKELEYQYPEAEILTPTHQWINLLDRSDTTIEYLSDYHVDYVFHCAGLVGGIAANIANPVQFLDNNYLMTSNILYAACRAKVKKVCILGSSCMYPKY